VIRSAAYRIAVVYSAAFAAAVILLGAGVGWFADHGLRRELDARIAAEASSLASEYRGEGLQSLRVVIRRRETARATNDLGYALYDGAGRRVGGLLDASRPAPGWQDLSYRDPVEGADEARALAVDLGGGLRLVVAKDWDDLVATERVILSIFVVALILVLLFGVVGAAALGAYLTRRLSRISLAAERIVEGDLDARVPVGRRGDEFDRVGVALNLMLDRIGELLDNIRQVSSDVAHDLRTPLGRLRNRLEEGLHTPDPAAVISGAIASADEVLALFAAILRISEIDAGGLRAAFGRLDLSALVREIVESYQPAIEDGGRSFACSIDDGVLIEGDRELVAQAVVNLLDNAQIHTPAGVAIVLRLEAAPDATVLSVADDGPGVPADDRERVKRRFIRLERSRSRPGHGLGLSLVAAVARIHHAELELADNRPGLRATLRFPG
jgi:hypothetical protein